MSRTKDHPQQEVDTAWNLWNALNEHAETLWNRYEASFVDLIIAEQMEEMRPPPEPEDLDFEDDIPF
ncbi:MAG: hypothetical protein QNK37_38745 [Acidobacteriota bacterium]|nr:hypothetical protein [Acidobacteriota bacterium]